MPQRIFSVDPESPGDRAGLRPGDTLLTINGHAILDVLDYRYHSEAARLRLEVERQGKRRTLRLRKEESDPLCLNFETYLMDRPRG